MATNKPRITLTLEPENYELIVAVAKAQDLTPSKFINGLLFELSPGLNNMLTLIGAAKNAPKEVLEEYAGIVDNEITRAADYLRANQNQVDWLADSIGRRVSQPPYINKGVRSKTANRKSSNHKGSVVSGHFKGKGVK